MDLRDDNLPVDVLRLPYAKPQVTVFGDVRHLTTAGLRMGSENGSDTMIMA
jgi:hypothetical protein